MDKGAAKAIYDAEVERYALATAKLKELLHSLLEGLSGDYGVREGSWVSGEVKGFGSFFEKASDPDVTDRDSCLKRVHDFGRARIVVQTVDDVRRLISLLDGQELLVPYWETAEDYIQNPNERGYRSYHIDVGVEIPWKGKKETVRCELQIRSAIQQAWSGFSHKDFYKGKKIPPIYEDQMREMSDLLAAVDRMAANLIKRLDDEPVAVETDQQENAETTTDDEQGTAGEDKQAPPDEANATEGSQAPHQDGSDLPEEVIPPDTARES
jgi:ppGpp synthetase/RelA/SpoT-type nucleotidyltranferase